MPEPTSRDADAPATLTAHWQAETLRLREAGWGPLEDAAEVRQSLTQAQGFAARLVVRAHLLARREGLDRVLDRWTRIARLTLAALMVAALLAGAGAAAAALGDGTRPVNLPLALTAMLGLHLITFLLWLASFGLADGRGAWLGECWLWLSQRLARGPDSALAPQAFTGVLARAGALRWVLGAVSHAFWALAFAAVVATLIALLSTRRYTFQWETTILSSDAFVRLTHLLGMLPSRLGFGMPSEDVIRLSNGLHVLPESAQSTWSAWLIGCVVVYGLIPRAMALALCAAVTWRRLRHLRLDDSLPGFAELRGRLEPGSEASGVDAQEGPDALAALVPGPGAAPHAAWADTDLVLVGIELPSDAPWPPVPLPDGVRDLGILDSREQRRQLLDSLQRQPARRLLMVCDASQTPDRGTVALLTELASLAVDARIAFLRHAPAGAPDNDRWDAWQRRLLAAGFSTSQLQPTVSDALRPAPSGTEPARSHPDTSTSAHGRA